MNSGYINEQWTVFWSHFKKRSRILWDDKTLKCVIIGLPSLNEDFIFCDEKKTMKNKLDPIDIFMYSELNETIMLYQNNNWFKWAVQSDAMRT